MAASKKGQTVTNGMSYSARDGKFANSALLVDVRISDFPSDDVLAGVDFQERYERLAFANGNPPRAGGKILERTAIRWPRLCRSLLWKP